MDGEPLLIDDLVNMSNPPIPSQLISIASSSEKGGVGAQYMEPQGSIMSNASQSFREKDHSSFLLNRSDLIAEAELNSFLQKGQMVDESFHKKKWIWTHILQQSIFIIYIFCEI